MEELHNLSELLIERETIDKDQFERLLAGESPESVFPEGEQVPAAEDEAEKKPRAEPKPRPFRFRARRCSLRPSPKARSSSANDPSRHERSVGPPPSGRAAGVASALVGYGCAVRPPLEQAFPPAGRGRGGEREPDLVLRRRALPRAGGGLCARARLSRRGRCSRGRGRRVDPAELGGCLRKRGSAESSRAGAAPGLRGLGGHLQGRGGTASPGARGRHPSTTSPHSEGTRSSPGSLRMRVPISVSCTCSASRGRCRTNRATRTSSRT